MEQRFLYCPNTVKGVRCGNKLCRIAEGRFKTNIEIRCRKCNKLIKFDKVTEEITVDELPKRERSGGTRLY